MLSESEPIPAKICIVIPTYNERENIGQLINDILRVAVERGLNIDILVVDDNSPDGTGSLIKEISRSKPNVHLLERPGKLGLGSAYRDGFSMAMDKLGADVLIEMDADGSHNPEYLPSLVKGVLEGYDIVVGSRYVTGGSIIGWGLKRRVISAGANSLAKWVCGVKVKDATSGYRAIRVSSLKSIGLDRLSSGGFAFQVETLFWAERLGLKIGETPITFVDRVRARSKLGWKEMVSFAALCFKLFFKRISIKISLKPGKAK
jgi:dolichol-phosphate mannosyltransferase